MPLRPLIRLMRLMELIMGVVGQGELPAIAPHAAGGGKKEEYFARFLMDGNKFFIENSNRKQTSQERRIIS